MYGQFHKDIEGKTDIEEILLWMAKMIKNRTHRKKNNTKIQ